MTGPSAGAFHGREHRLAVRVYYEDTDFTGVVYHANWLRYLERGRSDFLRLAGVDHTLLLESDDPVAFVVTRMQVDWIRPARVDDALEVRTTYDSVRGPRLNISQVIVRGEEILLRATVEAACVALDGRPKKPPLALRAAVRPWLAAP